MPEFYSGRQAITVDDVFPGWILAADVSSVTAVGGGGKGLMSADIMARISRGWPMPPYVHDDPLHDPAQCATPGYVLHCPLEDDPDRTMKHRLAAAGADETKIALLEHLELPADLARLRSEIDDIGDCRLVVIDPWMSAATSTVSYNQQLRNKLLNPLIHIARDTGAGIWLLNHFTKGVNGGRISPNSGKSILDYIAGSKGFTDTLRMNTVIADSPLDPRIKEWSFGKGNGGGADPLEYMIVARFPNDPDAHIRWRAPAVNANDPRVFERIQARVLDELLAAAGPVTAQQMVQLVQQSYAVVNRAFANLAAAGMVTKRRGAYEPAAAISPARAASAPAMLPAGHPAIGARLDAILNRQEP